MKSPHLLALMLIQATVAFAADEPQPCRSHGSGTLQICRQDANAFIEQCDKRVTAAKAFDASQSGTAGKGSRTSVRPGAESLANVASLTSGEYAEASKFCQKCLDECQSSCKGVPAQDQAPAGAATKRCRARIGEQVALTEKGAQDGAQAKKDADDTQKSADEDQSQQGQSQQMPQMPQSEDAGDSATPSSISPVSTDSGASDETPVAAAAEPAPTEKAGFDGASFDCQAAGHSICPSCRTGSLSALSASEKSAMKSRCADDPKFSDPSVAAAVNEGDPSAADSLIPASLAGAITPSAGAGAGGGAMASAGGAKLDPVTGKKEAASPFAKGFGGSLDTGGGGGGASGGSAYAGYAGDDSAEDPRQPDAASRKPGAAALTPASVAAATDIDRRLGPSVFSISSDTLKARCRKGLFLHCPGGPK